MLKDVVGRPTLEGFNGNVFPHRARDKNKRGIRADCSRDLKGRIAIETGKRQVGQNHIPYFILQPAFKVLSGLDRQDVTTKAPFGQ